MKAYVSTGWEHVNFLGEYRFDPKGVITLESLRPLNQG